MFITPIKNTPNFGMSLHFGPNVQKGLTDFINAGPFDKAAKQLAQANNFCEGKTLTNLITLTDKARTKVIVDVLDGKMTADILDLAGTKIDGVEKMLNTKMPLDGLFQSNVRGFKTALRQKLNPIVRKVVQENATELKGSGLGIKPSDITSKVAEKLTT